MNNLFIKNEKMSLKIQRAMTLAAYATSKSMKQCEDMPEKLKVLREVNDAILNQNLFGMENFEITIGCHDTYLSGHPERPPRTEVGLRLDSIDLIFFVTGICFNQVYSQDLFKIDCLDILSDDELGALIAWESHLSNVLLNNDIHINALLLEWLD